MFGLASSTLLTVLVIPAIYIALRQPGDRCNTGIPGPDGFMAVAIEAGSLCERAGLR